MFKDSGTSVAFYFMNTPCMHDVTLFNIVVLFDRANGKTHKPSEYIWKFLAHDMGSKLRKDCDGYKSCRGTQGKLTCHNLCQYSNITCYMIIINLLKLV